MNKRHLFVLSAVSILALVGCRKGGGKTTISPSNTSESSTSTSISDSSATSHSGSVTSSSSGQTSQSSSSLKPTTSIDPSPEHYYDSINDSMKGSTLTSALYNIIKGHTKYNYDNLEIAMRYTDRNWDLSPDPSDENPYMKLLYFVNQDTTSNAKLWNTYHGSGGMLENAVWDKEHMWPKSNGFNTKGCEAYSDLHHLRASDMHNNNTRSNLPYGPATGSNWVKDYDGNDSGLKTKEVYLPQACDRGDCARALFYMATRYSTGDGSNGSKLSLTTGTDSSGGKWGYLTTLLQWHHDDPPDAWEINRNNLVQDIQGNRNPFIDHPEYADRIWG